MERLKKMEADLLAQWHLLQLETEPLLKANATDAYYINYRIYQTRKKYLVRLSAPVRSR